MIDSPRLTMRPHEDSDVAFMVALNSDPEVVRYTGDAPFTQPSDAAIIVQSLQRQFAERRLGRLVVIDRETGERLGWCGFRWHAAYHGVDLGFRFFRRHWSRGYATEASVACLAWLAAHTTIRTIVANAIPENIGSVRVLQKLGFTPTGEFDKDGFQRFVLPPHRITPINATAQAKGDRPAQ